MKYTIPHIKQSAKWDCWHAAARMLWAYKFKQDTAPLADAHAKKTGLNAADIARLAQQMGLRSLPAVNQTYSINYMIDELTSVGPLFAIGDWFEDGGRHAVIVSGAESDGILDINDPWFDRPIVKDMSWFNDNVESQWPTPLMYL